MQTTLSYTIKSSWPRYLHDTPSSSPELSGYMRDALAVFRVRLEQLADMQHQTTKGEGLALNLMLNTLIEAKLMSQKTDIDFIEKD